MAFNPHLTLEKAIERVTPPLPYVIDENITAEGVYARKLAATKGFTLHDQVYDASWTFAKDHTVVTQLHEIRQAKMQYGYQSTEAASAWKNFTHNLNNTGIFSLGYIDQLERNNFPVGKALLYLECSDMGSNGLMLSHNSVRALSVS